VTVCGEEVVIKTKEKNAHSFFFFFKPETIIVFPYSRITWQPKTRWGEGDSN
jgi:hypothetical protein